MTRGGGDVAGPGDEVDGVTGRQQAAVAQCLLEKVCTDSTGGKALTLLC